MPAEVAIVTTHISPARGFGGVAACAGALVHAWRRQNRSFAVASSNGSCDQPITPQDIGLPACVPVRLYAAYWAVRWGFGLGALTALWTTCRTAAVVYVCGVATWPVTLAYLFCRLQGRPYVAAVHGGLMPAHIAHIRQYKPLKWLFYKLLVFPALRRARAVHAASPLERDGVLDLLPGLPVAVVPNGVDVAFWRTPARSRRAEDGLKLCYVGRLSREKGILHFLEIWRRVCRPGDCLTIVGEGRGGYADTVRQLADDGGGAVVLAGPKNQEGVRAALTACDFVVLPSGLDADDIRENFGNVVAEGLAAGRPALVVRGLAWDDLGAAGAAILFDRSESAVAAAIDRARATDPAAYAAMAAAARMYAETRLDLELAAAQLWRVITEKPDPKA